MYCIGINLRSCDKDIKGRKRGIYNECMCHLGDESYFLIIHTCYTRPYNKQRNITGHPYIRTFCKFIYVFIQHKATFAYTCWFVVLDYLSLRATIKEILGCNIYQSWNSINLWKFDQMEFQNNGDWFGFGVKGCLHFQNYIFIITTSTPRGQSVKKCHWVIQGRLQIVQSGTPVLNPWQRSQNIYAQLNYAPPPFRDLAWVSSLYQCSWTTSKLYSQFSLIAYSYFTHHTWKYFGLQRQWHGGCHYVARVDCLRYYICGRWASRKLPSAYLMAYEKGQWWQALPLRRDRGCI